MMISHCPICGFPFADPISETDLRQSFTICDCCGCEYGYDDNAEFRHKWLVIGATWFNIDMKPPEWDVNEQLKHSLLNWNTSNEHNTINAVLVRFSNIPDYLRKGSFFKSLNTEEPDDMISIPSECYAAEDCVNNQEDFKLLLKVAAFWGLFKIPSGIIAYCYQHNLSPTEMWKEIIETDFTEVDFAQELASIFDCSDPLTRAIELGRTEVVEFLVERCVSMTTEAITSAALHGRVDYICLLREHNYPWDKWACESAAKGGHLHCLQYLHENGCPWNNILQLEAAEHNHLHCTIYAHKHGMVWHKDLCDELALQGNIEGLKYLRVNGGFVSETTLECAVSGKHTECAKYLLECGCPQTSKCAMLTCKNGFLEGLMLLHQFGARWDELCMSTAARYGHVSCVQYLHENDCPWDEYTTIEAASNGHAEVLRYSISHGCMYPNDIVAVCGMNYPKINSIECIQYLVEEVNLPVDGSGIICARILARGNYEAAEYLVTHGYYCESLCEKD